MEERGQTELGKTGFEQGLGNLWAIKVHHNS